MGPLLYLTLCSLRNRTRIRLRRLREPRYLIGTIVGLAYLWLVFWRPRPRTTPIGATGGANPALEVAGAAVLLTIAALSWLTSRNRPALAFSRADVQFLFPAPFARRELIRYKVLRSQTGIFIGSAFMMLFFRPASLASGWTSFIGIALTITTLNLHLMGVSLSRESLGAHGKAGLARQWLPVALVIAAEVVLIGTVAMDWQTLTSMPSGAGTIAELVRLGTTGAAGIVLWPFRALTSLPFAATPSAFLHALPWALLILILNYIWVVRSDAKFEEASAELAEKIAGFRKGPQPKARNIKAVPTPFTLSVDGRPEMAIFWKNLILLGRYASVRTLLRLVPIFFMLVLVLTRGGRPGGVAPGLAAVCTGVFALTILLGPFMARNDLRQDLTNLALMKTWPIGGAALVRGEVLAPAALLTVIAWLCSLGGLVFAAASGVPPSWVVAAALIAPGLILLQLLMQNAIAVMWPSWALTGTPRVRGIDVMGQRMILMLGLLLVLVVAVLPAALVAGASELAIYYLTGTVTVILPSIVGAIVLFAEALAASEAIGKMLDRTDVSALDAVDN